ncbi:hypothetical protein TanjilG_20523 [Lupinus angustifolius]|uniref:Uncharacterized protein n=1 Tax=Lupinus angustifolius TaxID=3871 RepID=A0A1J7HHY1_LUPAN|nr:hypothetical protein TanjilG_20523 [Lupinus angustifolius]
MLGRNCYQVMIGQGEFHHVAGYKEPVKGELSGYNEAHMIHKGIRITWHIWQGEKGISLLHSLGRSNAPSNFQEAVARSGMSVQKLSLYILLLVGRRQGEGGGYRSGSISSEFPIQIEAPIKKILRRLWDRVRLLFAEKTNGKLAHRAGTGTLRKMRELRIRQKYKILTIRSVLLRKGRIDDQVNSGEEVSFNATQDNRAIIVGRVKSIQRKAAFDSLLSSWLIPRPTSTPR